MPADLALHPRQAADELGLVLRVAVAEVARIGWRRPGGGPRSGSSAVGILGRRRSGRRRSASSYPLGVSDDRPLVPRSARAPARLAADGSARPSSPTSRRRLRAPPADGSPTGERALRPRQRGGDGPDPRLLRGPLGVRAAHVPDPVEPRRRRRRELLAGLLPARPRPLPRADDAPPEARAQEEPQAAPPARALSRTSTSSCSTPATSGRSCSSTGSSPWSTTCPGRSGQVAAPHAIAADGRRCRATGRRRRTRSPALDARRRSGRPPRPAPARASPSTAATNGPADPRDDARRTSTSTPTSARSS